MCIPFVQPLIDSQNCPDKSSVEHLPLQNKGQNPKILDQTHNMMRLLPCSINTERVCIDWIEQYIR